MTDLARERIEPLLRGRFGRPYLHESSVETTQLLVPSDGPEGAVATVDHQDAGRGRHGRAWVDAPGTALLVSVLLRPPPGAVAAQLSLVCALSVADAVEAGTSLEARLKWPNDVLVDGRKVAGILLDGRGDAVVCGIGINVNQSADDLPADARTRAGLAPLADRRRARPRRAPRRAPRAARDAL